MLKPQIRTFAKRIGYKEIGKPFPRWVDNFGIPVTEKEIEETYEGVMEIKKLDEEVKEKENERTT